MLLSPEASQSRSRLLGSILALSAVTHVSQLAVYGTGSDTVGSAAFGVLYAAIAAGVFRQARPAFLAAAIFPAIGGLLGLYRLVAVHPNPFSVFHPILDVVIVPLAISLWRSTARK